MNKAKENLAKEKSDHQLDFIFVKTENRLEKIMVADILYIEGMRDYRRIHTTSKSVMTLQNFGELEQLIPSHLVCRVHKSYMVSLHRIEAVERGRIIIGDQRIPISATYKVPFFDRISGKS